MTHPKVCLLAVCGRHGGRASAASVANSFDYHVRNEISAAELPGAVVELEAVSGSPQSLVRAGKGNGAV